MPNGENLLNDMEFEQRLTELEGDELTKFLARQLYAHCKSEAGHGSRIGALESRDRKVFGYIGALGTFVGGLAVGLINFIMNRL